MKIQNVNDQAFGRYGKVLAGYDVSRLIKEMKHTPLPEDVIYVPSVEALEALPVMEEFKNRAYGGMPVQIGYCNGHNQRLNGLEYHRDSELNVAVNDLIILIGQQQDITSDYTYDTSLVEAFMIPAGTVVELYATTLHYAPCGIDGQGFKCVVVLPRDTNTDINFLHNGEGEDRLLTARNKWLIAHEEAGIKGAFHGLKGINITV